MYIVRNSEGKICVICTRKEDAMAFVNSSKLDNTVYTVTKE